MCRAVSAARSDRTGSCRPQIRTVGAVIFLMVALTGWRVLAISHAHGVLSAVNAENMQIKTVEIPKYDKAVKLRNQAQSLGADVLPQLTGEVDWLVVLNQLGQYIPAGATLSDVNMTATTMPGGAVVAPTSTPGEIATITTTARCASVHRSERS